MANGITNWAQASNAPSEKDIAALEKAKRQEARKVRKGQRWYTINGRTKVLIECDKKGNPTKAGEEMLERYKKLFM